MKINISTSFEIADESLDRYPEDERESIMRQAIFDNVTHYLVKRHLLDSLKWASKNDPAGKKLFNAHNNWATICENAKWKVDIEKE